MARMSKAQANRPEEQKTILDNELLIRAVILNGTENQLFYFRKFKNGTFYGSLLNRKKQFSSSILLIVFYLC